MMSERGCCQTNSNQSQFAAKTANLSGTKLTPLAKSGGAGQLEGVSTGLRSFLVEVVVDGGMDGGEFLQTSHAFETQHRTFAPSERKVRILDAVVDPPARPLFFKRAHFSERSLVGSKAIRDDLFAATVPLHQFPEEFQCSLLISAFSDNGFQHLAFMINGPPKIMPLAIHLHENLVHVPLPFGECSQLLNTLPSDLRSKHRPEPVPPIPDSFVAHVDASLVQQIFDIPKRERETDIQHHRKADYLWAGFEILERGRIGHGKKLRNRPARLKPSSSDKTPYHAAKPALRQLIEDSESLIRWKRFHPKGKWLDFAKSAFCASLTLVR